jgi:hypothetical protein
MNPPPVIWRAVVAKRQQGMDVKTWILSGVSGVLLMVLWWLVRRGINGIYERLDKMINQNNAFGKALIKQGGRISNLERRTDINERRLNDHSGRIRKLEIDKKKEE